MKKYIVILVVIFCFSCEEKQRTQPCLEIEKKYDSILKMNNEFVSSPFYKFHDVYISEKGDVSDTILISKYKDIISNDDVLKVYIDSRIETITNNYSFNEVMNIYEGIYRLKNYNSSTKDADFTSIEIKSDSCFLYKN